MATSSSWASLACSPAGRPWRAPGVGIHAAEPTGLADAALPGDTLRGRLDLLGRRPASTRGVRLRSRRRGTGGVAAMHAPRQDGAMEGGTVRFPTPGLP